MKKRITSVVRRLLGRRPAPAPKNTRVWSIGIFTGSSPLDMAPDARISNPVLTRDHILDRSAGFVADPFLVPVDGTWHLFHEVYNRRHRRGEIALATSRDLATWRYEGVVLQEPFHLSYPFVFEWAGEYFLIPETHETGTVRLYKADEFPARWSLMHTMLSGQPFADSTVVRHDDRWWLFTETSAGRTHDTLRLYFADDLRGAWTEHPRSPIVAGDRHAARPGGRIVATDHGLLRFAQDCAPRYGLNLNAFEITALTQSDYAERAAIERPVLTGSGSGWNASGMHHLDAHRVAPGRWVAAVDGWYPATKADVAGDG